MESVDDKYIAKNNLSIFKGFFLFNIIKLATLSEYGCSNLSFTMYKEYTKLNLLPDKKKDNDE